jgi:hypothetical protein
MSVPHTVADVIHAHVTLELECIDRMYLNVYQPHLQLEQHVFQFLRAQRTVTLGTGQSRHVRQHFQRPASHLFFRELGLSQPDSMRWGRC